MLLTWWWLALLNLMSHHHARRPRPELRRMYVSPQAGVVPFMVLAQGMRLEDPGQELGCVVITLDWGDMSGGTKYEPPCDPYAGGRPPAYTLEPRDHYYRRAGNYLVMLIAPDGNLRLLKQVPVIAVGPAIE